jgi:hypothetical protein
LKPPLGPVGGGSGYRYISLALVLFLPFALRMPTIPFFLFSLLPLSSTKTNHFQLLIFLVLVPQVVLL